jgi:hypothetical protein
MVEAKDGTEGAGGTGGTGVFPEKGVVGWFLERCFCLIFINTINNKHFS